MLRDVTFASSTDPLHSNECIFKRAALVRVSERWENTGAMRCGEQLEQKDACERSLVVSREFVRGYYQIIKIAIGFTFYLYQIHARSVNSIRRSLLYVYTGIIHLSNYAVFIQILFSLSMHRVS